jgi:hypothetical protein
MHFASVYSHRRCVLHRGLRRRDLETVNQDQSIDFMKIEELILVFKRHESVLRPGADIIFVES